MKFLWNLFDRTLIKNEVQKKQNNFGLKKNGSTIIVTQFKMVYDQLPILCINNLSALKFIENSDKFDFNRFFFY